MALPAAIVSVNHLVENFGYPLLVLMVMAESSGVPVPGEAGLIAAAVLASRGKLQIEIVIALAAAAAIIGDNIGYLIGRKGGRWMLVRPGRFHRQRLAVLETGEPFFERHGPKAVFFGRFVIGLRVWASWLAGGTRMRWHSFVLWNALGGICWATGVGLLAYFLGHSAGNAVEAFGLFGLAAVVFASIAVFFAHRQHRRRKSALDGSAAEPTRPPRSEGAEAVRQPVAGPEPPS